MKFKLSIVLLILFLFTGCSYTQTGIESFLKPPKLSDQQNEIYAALETSIGKNIRLKYPRKGDFVSAFLINNLDSESTQEAVVFYEQVSNTVGSSLRINLLDQKDGKWYSTYDARVGDGASEVEKVSLIPMNQKVFLMIGFNLTSTTDKIVVMYHYENGRLEEKFRINCTNYEVIDLNGDGVSDLVTIMQKNSETEGRTVKAELRKITSSGDYQIMSTVEMDPNVTEYKYITKGLLKDGRAALYLDGVRGTNVYTPEILACEDNQIKNLMYTPGISETNTVPVRTEYSAPSVDLDGDKIVEIPVNVPAPGYEGAEKHQQEMLTEWYIYENSGLSRQKTTYVAYPRGYLFTIPEEWLGKVSVSYISNDDELVFYEYEKGKELSKKILSIKVFTREIYEREAAMKGYRLLRDNGQIMYTYQLYSNDSELTILPEQITNNFQLYKL